jgi:ATP-dependent Lon protease
MADTVQQQNKYNTRAAAMAKQATSKAEPKKTKDIKKKDTKKKEAIKTPEVKPQESSDDEEDDDEDDDEESEEDVSDEETDEDDYTSEEDEEYTPSADEEEVDEKLSHQEYQKFLSDLFPSKYMSEKVAALEHKKTSNTKCPGAPKKPSRRRHDSSSSASASCSEDEEEETEVKAKNGKKNPMKNFNISFIINDQQHAPACGEYLSSTEALYDEAYSDSEEDEEKAEETKTAEAKKAASPKEDNLDSIKTIKALFESLTAEQKAHPVMKDMLDDLDRKEARFLKKEELKNKKKKIENTKKLKTLLRERDVMNDLQYFNEKMTVAEQESALQQIEEIKKHNDITKPYRLTLLDASIPSQYKAIAYRKISSLRNMEPGGGDYYKMKNWVDTFMQIPFGKYKNLPITIEDGVEKCHAFMDNAKQILDQAVYGLNDAKLQIMQMVGQWIVNPSAIGTAIAIKGPMGTGKTTLVKEGISKILGRDFVFIALGGATDSSFLEGHSYTYEGSSWGKIVDLLIKCKSMNPVIYFDELDKISDTPKGEEIAGILTHLTDTAQNNQFHDRYFSEIEFDLSRCLFIFSYNDESKVNKILLDRMYRIQTQGYNQAQKTTISNKYLLPKICEQVKFQMGDITIAEDTLHYIITNYTDKEDGVRTLKRCLEIIYTKLNLYRLMRPDTNIFESEMSIKVEFPMQVTTAIVDKLIKKVVDSGSWHNMYM